MGAFILESISNRSFHVITVFTERSDPTTTGDIKWEKSHHSLTAYNGFEAYIGTRELDDPGDWVAGPRNDLNDSEFERLVATMTRIPDENMFPIFGGHLAEFNPAATSEHDYFLKRPNISVHAKDDALIAKIALAEARTNEALLMHPHPNLGTYLGCVVREGRLVGLAFPKYVETLSARVETTRKAGSAHFTVEQGQTWMDSIQSAARHLHSVGYGHNDISACNIMFDRNDVPVLIDFDSCTPLGEKLTKGGVVGGWRGPRFSKEQFQKSSVECDECSIQFVRDWLVDELSSVQKTG